MSLPAVRPAVVHFWQTGWFQIAVLITFGVVVLICLQLMARLTVQSRSQRFLHLERARIARDIHDDLGARLTQLVLLGEVARSELPADSEARAQVDQVCDRARDLSHAMDEVVWAVNSRRDTLRDFVSYVCKYAQLFLASTPVRCRLDVEPNMPAVAFDLPVRRNLFLAVKEALNNAAKHSEANELFLRILRRDRGLTVVVEDNGKGLPKEGRERLTEPYMTTRSKGTGLGLAIVKKIMEDHGGYLALDDREGGGARISLVFRRDAKEIASVRSHATAAQ